MRRLTERDEFGNADIIGVDGMDLQCSLEFYEFSKVANALNKLAEYEDLEEQGKLLKLPCAAGDAAYEAQDLRKRIQPYAIIAAYGVDAVLTQLHNAGGCDGSTEYARGWDDAMEEAERIVKAGRKSDVKAGWKERIARRFGRVE